MLVISGFIINWGNENMKKLENILVMYFVNRFIFTQKINLSREVKRSREARKRKKYILIKYIIYEIFPVIYYNALNYLNIFCQLLICCNKCLR